MISDPMKPNWFDAATPSHDGLVLSSVVSDFVSDPRGAMPDRVKINRCVVEISSRSDVLSEGVYVFSWCVRCLFRQSRHRLDDHRLDDP